MVTTTDTERFLPYVPRLVREWLDSPDPDATHRVMEGSTIFADISGFTKLSERLARIGQEGAEEVTEVIGQSFSLLLEPAYSYDGTLVKFGGDALLLFYRGDDHELRAASAALEMRRAIRSMGSLETPVGKVTLRMSQGVHSGAYDVFLVGSSMRELIMAGSATTELGQLEGAANAGQIIVSEATARALPAKNIGDPKADGFFLRGSVLPLEPSTTSLLAVDHDLAPFVPTAVREAIATGAIASEHRPITTAFVRFTGLDALLEESPEAVTDALGELIDDVEAATRPRNIASLNADVYPDGVKLLLTAGAPVTTGEDEENMLFAMREIMDKERALPLHIGITRGPAFAGDVGAMFRRGYTVMGDEVNLAARLMSKAGPNQMLAIPEVLRASRTVFETTALEPFMVKGKSKPITAYVVGPAQDTRAEVSAHDAPFVGRNDEMDRLETMWEKAVGSAGSMVLVGGQPGLGKSRLITEFAASVEGADVYRAVCRRYRASTPYFAAGMLLKDILGISKGKTAEARLHEIVESAAPDLLPYLSLIGTALGMDLPESDEVTALAQEFRKARLEASVEALLTALLIEPSLLWLDDAQWMDDASVDLVTALAAASGERPWLIVGSGRGVEQAASERDVEAPTMTLEPLSDEEATAIVHQMSEDAPLPPHFTAAIVDRSQGNPMFLLELVAASDSEDVDALPESIEGVISARIDRLPPEDRNALRQLAVLGTGFRPEYAKVVLPVGASPAATFRRLADFVDADREWVKFSNSLAHSAAYSGLPYRQRRKLHGLVAESIEQADGSPDLLSIHYSAAARWPEAWENSRIAGDRAKAIYANIEAARLYERALEAARYVTEAADDDRVEVLTSLGDVREQSGSFGEALDAYRKATRSVGDHPVQRADLHLKRARAREREGAYSLALREVTTGRKAVDSIETEEAEAARARLLALGAAVRFAHEQYRFAVEQAEEAIFEAKRSNELAALARAYGVLDMSYRWMGEGDKADHSVETLRIYEELGDLNGVGVVTGNMGAEAYFDGRWDDALACYARSRDAFSKAGNEVQAALAAAAMGELLTSQGKLDEAEPLLRESRRISQAAGFVDGASFAEIHLGRVLAKSGDLDGAREVLEHARDSLIEIGETPTALEATIQIAGCCLQRGQAEEALELLEEAEALAGGEARVHAAPIARMRAGALAQLDRFDDAAEVAEAGLKEAIDQGLPYEEAQLIKTRADIAVRAGEEPPANELARADQILRGLGAD
jgi:class 3 adenylate cyclase/tetratricopeptide (TPR) repeat protein